MINKNILIITSHFPPSNLAGVHRSRLFAQHLASFGWKPIILTIHEKYHEENLDYNLEKILPAKLSVYKVNAFSITRPRLLGDLGLRGFPFILRKAISIIKSENIDFIYITIPSFYLAVVGRILFKITGIKYGIDYIDPWVHKFPGSERIFSRHWFSMKFAKLLEPIAVKKASLITAVADGYYKGVLERNPKLIDACIFESMPYGGEIEDHLRIREFKLTPFLFAPSKKMKLIYAGAFLPKAKTLLLELLDTISNNIELFRNVEIHFIGTGYLTNDDNAYTIKPLAEEFGLYGEVVFEHPKRIPYLDVLVHLENSDGVFILGSTESHYTPSKTYQAVLSKKPVWAILHKDSSAAEVLIKSNAGVVLTFDGENDLIDFKKRCLLSFKKYLDFSNTFKSENVDLNVFNQYSAFETTKKLANAINKSIGIVK